MEGYVNFLAAQLFCEVSGMNAENDQRKMNGESMAYTDESFGAVWQRYQDLFIQYGIEKKRSIDKKG